MGFSLGGQEFFISKIFRHESKKKCNLFFFGQVWGGDVPEGGKNSKFENFQLENKKERFNPFFLTGWTIFQEGKNL